MKINKKCLIIFLGIVLLSIPMITLAENIGADILKGIFPPLTLLELANNIKNDPTGMSGSILNGLASFAFVWLSNIAKIILMTSTALLDWVISPNFLNVSMTGPATANLRENVVVLEAWQVVRNIANIALIFGLVVIAINIILGNQEIKAKKALINFVLIALLINFTPLIAGIIIDVSNMLMSYFLKNGVTQEDLLSTANVFNAPGNPDIGLAVAFFLFSLFASLIYFFYALLFLARYVMLWILIIFSPLAFATKVFPKSRYITKIFPSMAYWDEWWDQFIQWCVIGIPASFFIYLSNRAMVEMATNSAFSAPAGDPIINPLVPLFTYIIPFLFMWVGFFETLSSGGVMGQKISGLAKGTFGAVSGYAMGRAQATGTRIKEGAMGTLGTVLYNRGKSDEEKVDWKTREGRDKGREVFKELKQSTKDKIADTGLASRDWALTKSKAEIEAEKLAGKMDLQYYNKHYAELNYEQRRAADAKFAKQDVSAYLKGAGNNKDEYQRRLDVIANNDDGSKEWKRIKTKALMNAKFKNSHLAGKTDWAEKYHLDLQEEIASMSPRDLRDNITKETIKGFDVDFSPSQLKYLRENGTKEQTDALNDLNDNLKSTVKNKMEPLRKIISDPNKSKEEKEAAGKEMLKLSKRVTNHLTQLSEEQIKKYTT